MKFIIKTKKKSYTNQVKEISKSLTTDDVMEKGRAYPVGTIREWKGQKYIKTAQGWKPKSEGRKQGKKEDNTKTAATTDNKISEIGDIVEFTTDKGNKIKGEVVAVGQDGVQVKNEGVIYKVKHENTEKVQNKDGTIPASKFNANDYKKSFTDSNVTPDKAGVQYIYDKLGEEGKVAKEIIEKKLKEQDERMEKLGGDTQKRNQVNGKYTPERRELHEAIIKEILSPEKERKAKPKNGEKPKYIIFGGRGGSGKSWFTDKKRAAQQGREVMFDSDNYITLDADEIKKMLPEFEGWNAGEVHEESSDLMKEIKKIAMEKGLNIIVDGTMGYNPDKPDKVKNEVLEAKDKGYSTEAHYMFNPVQNSCVNAINRFKTKKGDWSGRLVPMPMLVSMQDNEKSFDSVKDIVDDWSFRDNQDFNAKVISQKNK